MHLTEIQRKIYTIDGTICKIIEELGAERGLLSQTVLAQLRTFVEHVMVLEYAQGIDVPIKYDIITTAINYTDTHSGLKFLNKFHRMLQSSMSHYATDEEGSERLMLKYYEHLFKIKEHLKKNHKMDVLNNLVDFPLNTDSSLREYYEKIVPVVDKLSGVVTNDRNSKRFRVHKKKPFFVKGKIYYEITFTDSNADGKKVERIIAFTDLDLSTYYAVNLRCLDDDIEVFGKTMPILVVTDWSVSIRPCEFKNYAKILGLDLDIRADQTEYIGLMKYLKETGLNLNDIIGLANEEFEVLFQKLAPNAKTRPIYEIMKKTREIVLRNGRGSNTLRYLSYGLFNEVLRNQYSPNQCEKLSQLYVQNGCIPFDDMPFATSLISHNPALNSLFECIDSSGRDHELLARQMKNNAEISHKLYTPAEELIDFVDIESLIEKHNSALWWGHNRRRLEKQQNHYFISEYRDNAIYIINRLIELSESGIDGYSNWARQQMTTGLCQIDSEEKKIIIEGLFDKSSVGLIYGSAGTGKSTLIGNVSNLFSKYDIICLANTNSAVKNLKRRVTSSSSTVETIAKYVGRKNDRRCNLLILDECSVISNSDMRKILEKTSFELLLLVGDTYQIESISFGNWFEIVQEFLSPACQHVLKDTHRSKNEDLLELWKKVRKMDNELLEHITRNNYSSVLDESLFDSYSTDDEVILCPNYDGLYGINNINRFLQKSNPSAPIEWGIQKYKVNDPILFNDSTRFEPFIYSNMKGRIMDIQKESDRILFDIEIDEVLMDLNAGEHDFELLKTNNPEKSTVRFFVYKHDDDVESDSDSIVPFNVAYAVSIHKAQGLEYDSVKIVIPKEAEKFITHNIFYTAITRARQKLKIYWTPEVENTVLSKIAPKNNDKDAGLLRATGMIGR